MRQLSRMMWLVGRSLAPARTGAEGVALLREDVCAWCAGNCKYGRTSLGVTVSRWTHGSAVIVAARPQAFRAAQTAFSGRAWERSCDRTRAAFSSLPHSTKDDEVGEAVADLTADESLDADDDDDDGSMEEVPAIVNTGDQAWCVAWCGA